MTADNVKCRIETLAALGFGITTQFIVRIDVLLNVKTFERAKKSHEGESDRMAKDEKVCPENQRFLNKRAIKQNNEVANRQGLMKKSARRIKRFPKQIFEES